MARVTEPSRRDEETARRARIACPRWPSQGQNVKARKPARTAAAKQVQRNQRTRTFKAMVKQRVKNKETPRAQAACRKAGSNSGPAKSANPNAKVSKATQV